MNPISQRLADQFEKDNQVKEHRHAEVLQALIEGEIWPDDFECKSALFDVWEPASHLSLAVMVAGLHEFRRKPVPKPDIVKTCFAYINQHGYLSYGGNSVANIEFTFSPDNLTCPRSVRLLP